MSTRKKLPIETKSLFGSYHYRKAKDIMEAQQDVRWTAQEIPVEKDKHNLKQGLSPEQLNLVTVTLQLFVEIEQRVGEVWDKIAKWFPHAEIEGACAEIGGIEKSVHAFFYQKVSDVLHIEPEVIAKNQEEIKVLKNKLNLIQKITSNLSDNKLLSLATVAFLEQVFLFTNFAELKSFQSNGHNEIKNVVTGVDFVVQDEQIHGSFASFLFRTMLEENDKYKVYDTRDLHKNILEVLEEIIKHEDAVTDYTFAGQTAINGTTPSQLKTFSRHRANEALKLLGYNEHFVIGDNPIADWFYRGANSIKVHDFFSGVSSQYRRGWKLEGFSRLPLMEDSNA